MAQSSKPKDVLAFIQSERERICSELGQLVAFKSVHSNPTQGPDLVAATPWGATVDIEIDDVNQGFATDPSQPVWVSLSECLSLVYGKPVGQIGMGATIPLTVQLQTAHPQAEIAVFGIEEPQCTIHSANESIDPTEIENIATAEALFLLRFIKK